MPPHRTEFTISYTDEVVSDVHSGEPSGVHSGVDRARLTDPIEGPRAFDATTQGCGWWRVTWNPVAGAGYEYSHELDCGRTPEPTTSIFPIPSGTSRSVKIRTLGHDDTVSAWVTVTVAVDTQGRLARVLSDNEPSFRPPDDPHDIVTWELTDGVALRWEQDGPVEQWTVYWNTGDGVNSHSEKVTTRRHVIRGLGPGRYRVGVLASWHGMHSSGEDVWAWVHVPDQIPEPPVPWVTVAGHRVAAVHWDPGDDVQWRVRLVTIDEGPVRSTDSLTEPRVLFNNLELNTDYGVTVQAVDVHGYESEWSAYRWFSTHGGDPSPEQAGDLSPSPAPPVSPSTPVAETAVADTPGDEVSGDETNSAAQGSTAGPH